MVTDILCQRQRCKTQQVTDKSSKFSALDLNCRATYVYELSLILCFTMPLDISPSLTCMVILVPLDISSSLTCTVILVPLDISPSLTCTVILVQAVHKNAGWAVMSQHKCCLRRIEKQFSTLSRPGVQPMVAVVRWPAQRTDHRATAPPACTCMHYNTT